MMKTVFLPVLLLTACLAFGCAGIGQRRSHHVKLSEAMEKSSDNHRGDRRIETETRCPYRPEPHRNDEPRRWHDTEPSETVPEVAPSLSPTAEKQPWLITFGARYKYFTTLRHIFLGHYFTAGVAYAQLHWSYENAIQLDDETIRTDDLEGLELFVGMGVHPAQTERFQLGLEILPSMTL
jgi:hypothetical protein